MSVLLFGRSKEGPRKVWNASDFINVDDTVRGGSSSSAMKVLSAEQDKADGMANCDVQDQGAIEFSGFLDTTTLGGAGFASQAYSHPFPGQPVTRKEFRGLRLVGRRLPTTSSSSSSDVAAKDYETIPGGGKAPVTSYVVNLKTEKANTRPDGRRESQVVYEWRVELNDEAENGVFDRTSVWDDFRPTYRGRPAPDAPALDPSKVQEWSIMARSDFTAQSGPFKVRLFDLSAVASTPDVEKRSGSYVVAMDNTRSSEYYGFALFIVATLAMFAWVVWAVLPDSALRKLGVEWYPNREWAFLVPAWSLVCVLFIYVIFIALNTYNTPRLDDISNIVDSHANLLSLSRLSSSDQHPLQGKTIGQTGGADGPMVNDVYDLPPGLVSREMHGL